MGITVIFHKMSCLKNIIGIHATVKSFFKNNVCIIISIIIKSLYKIFNFRPSFYTVLFK